MVPLGSLMQELGKEPQPHLLPLLLHQRTPNLLVDMGQRDRGLSDPRRPRPLDSRTLGGTGLAMVEEGRGGAAVAAPGRFSTPPCLGNSTWVFLAYST